MAKVLVADDSATIRGVAESLLRHNGYEVVSASDGSKALALAKSQNPDLIFLDYLMPGKDGLLVCRELRADARLRNIPVIMLLGAAEMKEAEKFLAAGASDCLFKPFVPKDFIEKAQKYLSPFSQSSALAQDTGKLATNALLEEALSSAAKEENLDLNELMRGDPLEEGDDTTGKIPTAPPAPGKPLNALEGKDRWGKSNPDDMTIKLYDTNKNIRTKPSAKPKSASGPPAPSTGSPPSGKAKSDSDKLKLEVDRDSLVLSSNPFGLGREDLEFSIPMEASGDEPHDFDWFMREMQKESSGPASSSKGKASVPPSVPAPAAPTPVNSSEALPPSRRKETAEELKLKVEEMGTSRLGYERFINEFKKEMQKLEGEEKPVYGETKIDPKAVVEAQLKVSTSKVKIPPPEPPLETEPLRPAAAAAPAGPHALDEMVNALITAVAKEIAVKISSQLDRKEIARLLEQKLSKIVK